MITNSNRVLFMFSLNVPFLKLETGESQMSHDRNSDYAGLLKASASTLDDADLSR